MICDVLTVNLESQIARNSGKIAEYEPKIDVYVNGIKFKGYIEIWSFFENTHLKDKDTYSKPYCDYRINDYAQYNRALKRFDGISSSVYFEMCSCGDPGCMGIFNGVRVYKKKKYFKYVAKKNDGYPNGILNSGKWNLTFTKENIQHVRKQIVDFFIQNEILFHEYYSDDIELAYELKRTL